MGPAGGATMDGDGRLSRKRKMMELDEEEAKDYVDGPVRKRCHDETQPGEGQNPSLRSRRRPLYADLSLTRSFEMQRSLPQPGQLTQGQDISAPPPPQPLHHQPSQAPPDSSSQPPASAGQLGSSSEGLVNETYLSTNTALRQLHEERLRRSARG